MDSPATNYVADANFDCDGADINKADYAASSTAESCCTYPTEEEIEAAEALIEEANQLVAQANLDVFTKFGEVGETEIDPTFAESPGSEINEIINMEDPYGKYEEALVLDPTNKGAHFGIGFMEVTLASQDELLESTLNEWAACIDSLGWFDKESTTESSEFTMPRSINNNNGYDKGIPQSGKAFFAFDALHILDYLPIITSHRNVLGRVSAVCPEISSIQDLLENVFLSRISTAISHLDEVVGTDFVFEITPAMLGEIIDDPDQDPIHIDDTEIYLMKALMHQLRAMIYAVITYDVNLPYYDLIEQQPDVGYDWAWLAQDSDLLTIRTGQEQSWANAHADLNNVVNSLESAWDFLNNDFATEFDIISANDFDEDTDDDVTEIIEELRGALNENYTISYEDCEPVATFDVFAQETCTEEEITINIKNFLTDPPQNLKEIFPSYTVTNDSCEDEDHEHFEGNVQINVTIENSSLFINGHNYSIDGYCGFDSVGDSIYVGIHHIHIDETSIPDSLKTELTSKIAAECNEIISGHTNMSITHFSSNFYFSGTISDHKIVIDENKHYWFDTIEYTNVGCPKLSWDATTCQEWKEGWDVTIGGLLPNMTTAKMFDVIIEWNDDGEDCEDLELGDDL